MSMGIPLIVLSFFFLSVLFIITLIITSIRLCKFQSFSSDSWISKIFYVFLFLVCLARAASFGVASFLYADAYHSEQHDYFIIDVPKNQSEYKKFLPTEEKEYMGIDQSPKSLVLLILAPEFLVIYAYLLLFWQLLSIYYDGHANIFRSVLSGKGKYVVSFIGASLLITQLIFIILYINSQMDASAFTKELIILNFTTPILILVIMLAIAFKFSGSPIRAAVYTQKLKLLQIAMLIWSITRVIRGTCGIFESRLFYGMILGLKNQDYNTYFIPMMIIVLFLVIEIGPFMFVLDWHFMEIFTMKAFPQTTTEPLFEAQQQNNLSYLSVQSNNRESLMQQQQFYDQFKSGMSSQVGDTDAYRSDSVKAFNESFNRGQYQEGLFISERDFNLYEQFSKGNKRRGLGGLYKVKLFDEEKQLNVQMLCRVIKFTRVKTYVIEEIFREAQAIKMLKNKYLLPIKGICFNDKTNVMHILMPQKISLYEYLHESGQALNSGDKMMIAKSVAKALDQLHSAHKPPAHSHLSSKNILLNPSDFNIYIADYGLKSLKKFCKLFSRYQNHNPWSAPEVWQDMQADFYDTITIDSYSFGVLLWELETGNVPFEGLDEKTMRYMLLDQRLRPLIPENTDPLLSVLIRRCWQDNEQKRPDFKKILASLDKITKAQSDLRDISDQKSFLHGVHQKIAETYDDTYNRREYSNKLSKYRRILLSYADGDVLEVGVDWSDNMLIKAFERVDEMKKKNMFNFDDFKLMTADAHDLPFDDDQFDTIVNTFGLEASYNLNQVMEEMKRVCKNKGKILLMCRGQSYLSIYNQWLQFIAARDLTIYGQVEQIDFESVIERQKGVNVIHKERKNMGMTYIYILENDKDPQPDLFQDQENVINIQDTLKI
ncbi:protein kinase [Stylonychia lemnae]|uniref:Protein kinase n=1 Tax=Stylonychia lemnae TaxID=5949 RepID=A0A078AIE1_STYLE|nr:protein kinase [Stylonychia lemnae]|eukprot:CDW81984.1 protein kinase [Stylonychia lemnae]